MLYGRILNDLIPEYWKEAPVERYITNQVVTFMTGEASFNIDFKTQEFAKPPYNVFSVLRGKFDRWMGEKADSIVLGIGLNVTPEAIPVNEDVLFPATSLEIELRKQVDRAALLKDILQALIHWRERMLQADFMQAWEARLSFRGEHVELQRRGSVPLRGQIAGLGFDGSLLLRDSDGVQTAIQFGEVHLRPVV